MELLDKDKKFLREYEEHVFYEPNGFLWFTLIILGLFVIYFIMDSAKPITFVLGFIIATIIMFSPVVATYIMRGKKGKILCLDYGISKQEADIRYSSLLNIRSLFSISLIFHHFCSLNPDAKSTQIESLKKWYCLDEESITKYFYDVEYDEENWDNAVKQLDSADLPYKKDFINRLFQLSILEDGIHNDEWKLLMQLITELEFNKHYVKYFLERYESLRTEFDEYEKRESTSKSDYSAYSLKEYYTLLGLDENATDEEVRRAYHELALQHHPDLPKNASRIEECEKMMMKINEAYEKVRR